MSGVLKDPPRLKEKHDQSDLAERIAGQAFRDMAPPAPLSSTALARIAAQVEERASASGTRGRLRWAIVCCALLLGIATAASAQHLDILPRWLGKTFAPKPKLVSRQQHATAVPRQARASRRTDVLPSAPVQTENDAIKAEPSAPVGSREASVTNLDRSKPAQPTASGDREARRSVPREEQSPRAATPLKMGAPLVAGPARSASAPSTLTPAPAIGERGLHLALVDRKGEATVPAQATPAAAPSIESRSALAPVPAIGEHGLHLALVDRKGKATALAKAIPTAKPVDPSKPAMTVGSQHAAKYLGLAIRALRVEHSPKSALALLDRHSAELHDAFAHETLLLRVEAMLALGQQSQVLGLLDGTALADMASSRALLVTRGQLRAAANRCSEAMADFDRVLAGDGQPPKQALLGRALCRKRLGDAMGAQSDLQRYRHEFPNDGSHLTRDPS